MATLYAYIDEAGDEGFPRSPVLHSDVTAYNDRSRRISGPSAWFIMSGALVLDADRANLQRSIRALANELHTTVPDKEIHWRNLDWERKQHTADECAKLDFTWVGVAAYKPALPNRLAPPLLYNYCTRLLLERLCITTSSRGDQLIPVFSNRARTNYGTLQQYVSSHVFAYGTATECLKPIRTQQPNKERSLQLADVCAGALHASLEVNPYGKLHTAFLRTLAPRFVRNWKGQVWGCGFKIHPKEAGTNYGPPTVWIDKVRGR